MDGAESSFVYRAENLPGVVRLVPSQTFNGSAQYE